MVNLISTKYCVDWFVSGWMDGWVGGTEGGSEGGMLLSLVSKSKTGYTFTH